MEMELTIMLYLSQETAQILLSVVSIRGTGEFTVGDALTIDGRASRRYRLISDAEPLPHLSVLEPGNRRWIQNPVRQTEYDPII